MLGVKADIGFKPGLKSNIIIPFTVVGILNVMIK